MLLKEIICQGSAANSGLSIMWQPSKSANNIWHSPTSWAFLLCLDPPQWSPGPEQKSTGWETQWATWTVLSPPCLLQQQLERNVQWQQRCLRKPVDTRAAAAQCSPTQGVQPKARGGQKTVNWPLGRSCPSSLSPPPAAWLRFLWLDHAGYASSDVSHTWDTSEQTHNWKPTAD